MKILDFGTTKCLDRISRSLLLARPLTALSSTLTSKLSSPTLTTRASFALEVTWTQSACHGDRDHHASAPTWTVDEPYFPESAILSSRLTQSRLRGSVRLPSSHCGNLVVS